MPQIVEAAPATYPIKCPHCRRVAGKPIAVSTIAIQSSFRIELACSTCHHRWAEVLSRAEAAQGA